MLSLKLGDRKPPRAGSLGPVLIIASQTPPEEYARSDPTPDEGQYLGQGDLDAGFWEGPLKEPGWGRGSLTWLLVTGCRSLRTRHRTEKAGSSHSPEAVRPNRGTIMGRKIWA